MHLLTGDTKYQSLKKAGFSPSSSNQHVQQLSSQPGPLQFRGIAGFGYAATCNTQRELNIWFDYQLQKTSGLVAIFYRAAGIPNRIHYTPKRFLNVVACR